MKVEEVCRRHGISSATYYNKKSKYGGMEQFDVKRLKEFEKENALLKRIYADLSLTREATQELTRKKDWWPLRSAKMHKLWCIWLFALNQPIK